MKSANWLLTLLKALGLGALALVAYVAFFLYAADTFWGNSQVTVTSQERGGLSVRLTHPRVVKGRGDRMTMTIFNHTSETVTVAEPFHCFFGPRRFMDSSGQLRQTAGNQACTTIALGPIPIPVHGSISAEVELYTESLPADTYKVTYDVPLRRVVGEALTDSDSYQLVPLNIATQVQVVPWWRLF